MSAAEKKSESEECINVVSESIGKDDTRILCMTEKKSEVPNTGTDLLGFCDGLKYETIERALDEIYAHKSTLARRLLIFSRPNCI
jgi:hypothetical protein